jgi:hypothetical protein
MIRKTVLVLNFCLMGMVCYIVGYHNGVTAPEYTVDQVAVEYAVYQAMN